VAEGEGFLIKAERATVRIYPENWTPVSASCVTASVDGELRPVNVIRFATGPVEEYTLTTRIEVLQ